MQAVKPLPDYLVDQYRIWKSKDFDQKREVFEKLVDEGQRPPAMVISCCDSRVDPTTIFGADVGEFFVHRNIANIVPPHGTDRLNFGTSAAIEYAVRFLKVSHIILIGHSSCGGVQGCYDMCSGNAPEFTEPTSFIGQWINILRPGFDKVYNKDTPRKDQLEMLEKQSVVESLGNLTTFPFVKEAIDAGQLELHGIWTNIRSGSIEFFDPDTKSFSPV